MLNKINQAFLVQRWHAINRRGISWNLTYQEWLDIWGDKLPLRGKGKGKYCMSRYGDTGPYEIGNVFISTNYDNNFYQAKDGRAPNKCISMTLVHENGNIKTFESINQICKFFNVKNSHFMKQLRENKSYKGWKLDVRS